MGTTLTGTKPKDTYDSLIKVEDNGPISGTAKYLSDGLGNNLPIAVSTSNVGIGTSAPAVRLDVSSAGFEVAAFRSTFGQLAISFANSGTTFAQIGSGVSVASTGGASDLGFGTAGQANASIIFATGAGYVERCRITNNGLTFNGDTAAANALDDYEEGTWTMGVSFGGASTGVTYDINTGTYVKIGRQVTVNGFLILTSKGSSTGDARITGLPFTIGNSDSNYAATALRFNLITFANQFQGFANPNSTTIRLDETTILGVTTTLTDADFANTSTIMVSLTYFV